MTVRGSTPEASRNVCTGMAQIVQAQRLQASLLAELAELAV